MNLISLLLALSPPLAARFKPEPNRLAEALQAELAKAREEITELRRERDVWRARAYEALTARAAQNAQAQAAQQSNLAQYQAAQQSNLAQYQAAMQQSQSLALQNVQCQQQNNRAQHVLLGAQNLSSLNPEMFCNCVPARHDLLLG